MVGVLVSGTLLERGRELAAVERAVAAAAAGDGGLLVIEGPAGIGKTRLLDAARAHSGDHDFRRLTARGGDLERDFAYGVVRQLLEREVADAPAAEREILLAGPAEHAATAIGLQPAAAQQTEDQSFAVRHGLYWLVSNLAAGGPLLLAVDDVQWSDAASLRFLAYLARRLDGLPVLLALTIRTGDAPTDDALLAALQAAAQGNTVIPGPLSECATAELMRERLAAVAGPGFAAACHAATGGNPFLVGELAAALAEDGVAPVDANASRVAELGPSTVARSVMLRLGRVAPETLRFARAVSVLGASAEPRHAAALAGVPDSTATTAFDALARIGVLARERPLRFAHPILREAVYRDLPPGERDALHAAAARQLAAAGAPASEIAAHLLATPPDGDPTIVAALREAARSALGQGAADLASRYLQRALEEPPGRAELPAIRAALGRAEWLAGEDPLAAIGHLRDALDGTDDPEERTALLISLARALFSVGDVAGGGDVLNRELNDADRNFTRDQRLLMEAEFGSIHILHGATPEFGERIDRFRDLAGETIPELLVLTNVSVWHWLNHDAETSAHLAMRSLGGGRAVEATGGDSIAVLQAAWVLCYAERHEPALETLQAGLSAARRSGSIFGLTAAHTMLALVAYRRGEIQRCEAEARSALELPGLPPFVHPTAHTYLALALVERGELDEADTVMEASWVGEYLPLFAHMNKAFWARGLLRLAQGRAEQARDDFLELGERDARIHIHNPGIPWRVGAARAYLRLGERDEARRLVADHTVDAQRWGTPGAIGVALHAQALVEGADPPRLEEAVRTLARSPARLDHAHAMVDLGAAQRAAGARNDAQATLREALERARACGATALVRRAHEELVSAGARPRRLQFSGLEALTASERRICELAAGGCSNREIAQQLFITPKTVENHLGRAYVKLGVSSRDALQGVLGDPPGEDEGAPLMS